MEIRHSGNLFLNLQPTSIIVKGASSLFPEAFESNTEWPFSTPVRKPSATVQRQRHLKASGRYFPFSSVLEGYSVVKDRKPASAVSRVATKKRKYLANYVQNFHIWPNDRHVDEDKISEGWLTVNLRRYTPPLYFFHNFKPLFGARLNICSSIQTQMHSVYSLFSQNFSSCTFYSKYSEKNKPNQNS